MKLITNIRRVSAGTAEKVSRSEVNGALAIGIARGLQWPRRELKNLGLNLEG